MKINQKLNNKYVTLAYVTLACKEVLNIFNQNNNSYLTITDISSALNISYQASKNRLHKLTNKNEIKRIYSGTYCLSEKLSQIELTPFYVKMNKHFTITVPARVTNLKNLKNQFVKIIVEKNNNKNIFLTKTYYNSGSQQTYVFVNEEIRKELNIKLNDEIKITNIEKIFPFKSTEEMFYHNQIDLLSLIPEKSKKDFNFFVEEFEKNNEKWLNIWYYSTNCGSKKYMDKEICKS